MAAKTTRAGVAISSRLGGVPGPPPPPMPASFPNKRSSGLFSAPKGTKDIDWSVVNGNIGTGHWIRVTVYKCPVGAAKSPIAGPTPVFLAPSVTTHLAVHLTAGTKSDYYEVVIEDEDLMMHPSVQLFRKYPGDVIAGTLIPAGDFVQTQA